MKKKDFETVKKLLNMMKEEGIQEFEIKKPFFKLRISKGELNTPRQVIEQSPVIPKKQEIEEARPEEVSPEPAYTDNYYITRSPLVGTFYRAPSPDASPYVDKGSVVKKGQVLCIIEAMKIMNEIESEVSGKVINILIENGEPVEYGQELFKIEIQD